ncbi:hypothetical protein BH10PSE1_BH10PSE1_08360 [soil metagenome]
MSIFEVVFNLVGLVLGLALVEVLSGLARLIKARDKLRIGWLNPLLAVLVLADVTSFWGQAYEIRERLPSVWPSLGAGLIITSVYYLAASFVVPQGLDDQTEYDHSYWTTKRFVLGAILLCNGAAWTISLLLGRVWEVQVWIINAIYASLLIAAIIVPGRRLNIAILAVMIAILGWAFATP